VKSQGSSGDAAVGILHLGRADAGDGALAAELAHGLQAPGVVHLRRVAVACRTVKPKKGEKKRGFSHSKTIGTSPIGTVP